MYPRPEPDAHFKKRFIWVAIQSLKIGFIGGLIFFVNSVIVITLFHLSGGFFERLTMALSAKNPYVVAIFTAVFFVIFQVVLQLKYLVGRDEPDGGQ
jgi:hypothetical protein